MPALPALLVLLSLAAAPGDARPMAPLDLSGIDLFWSTADRLADGERLTASDWDAFFSHPGYAVTESSGQRRSVITHCMPAVFAPDGDVAAAKENPPEGEGRLSLIGRVCDHMVTIAERRSDIEAWLEAVDGAGLVEAGKRAAARYLPAGLIEGTEAPDAYVLLFEAQGFGGDEAVVMDALLVMMNGDDFNVGFLGHEFHHSYRGAVTSLDPEPEPAPLVWALERIVNEGSASMVDKAGYIRTGTIPPGFPAEFLELVAGTPERMAAIDEALATLDPTPEGYEAAAEVVRGASPWGGHLTGVYMAMAIEEAFGAEGVVEAFGSPSAFLVRYQDAVEELGGDEWFRFSDGVMEGVRGLGEVGG
jgi:hypothetical protein